MTDKPDNTVPAQNHLSTTAAQKLERKIVFVAVVALGLAAFGGAFLFDRAHDAMMPPQPIYVPTIDDVSPPDVLTIKGATSLYDLPVDVYSSDDTLRTVRGRVTDIVPRTDRMTDGKTRENLYARTEYFIKEQNMNCYFHQYMGLVATHKVNDAVLVQFDPQAGDACGTSRIVK